MPQTLILPKDHHDRTMLAIADPSNCGHKGYVANNSKIAELHNKGDTLIDCWISKNKLIPVVTRICSLT